MDNRRESIILIGHGSPRREANNIDLMAGLLHSYIHPGCGDGCVSVAYLQFTEPEIMDAIGNAVGRGAERVILHPFFLSSGMHVTKDIPEMIEEAKTRYPGVQFLYTEPLGLHERMAPIIMERINAARNPDPSEIERRSFEMIGEEMDLSDIPAAQRPVVQRVIHATADFEFAGTLVFHRRAIEAGVAAIRAGKDILTDIEMVRTGINKGLLGRWGGKVICALHDIEPAGESHAETTSEGGACGRTRAERGIEKGLREHPGVGIIVIGNAPTALLRTIDILTSKESPVDPSHVLVVGVPVGFVKALESKTLLSQQDIPHITNLSRKGGTPVAVAVVNALLRMANDEGAGK